MALEWVEVSLRGHGGAKPTGTTFFELLGVTRRDRFPLNPSEDAYQAASVDLVAVTLEDCRRAKEPHEEFARRVRAGLRRAARWLSARKPQALARWRARRRTADVYVGGWVEDGQLDLTFPPEFLLACGRLGLRITICTND